MNPANIHVGAGTLTLNPDTTPVTFDSTSEGATLTYTAETEPILIDQILSPVGYYIPSEECIFETMVAEADANTIQYALGATDQTVTTQTADATHKGYTEIKFGGNYVLTDYVLEYKARKRNNLNLYVVIRLYIVNLSTNAEFAYKKDGVSYYKLTFKAVADTTKEYGQQLGYYRYETAEVTGDTPTLALSSSTPADEATSVAVDTDIDLVFNRVVKPESVIEGNFTLLDDTVTKVSSTVAYTGTGGTNITVTPSANLSTSTTYYLIISKDIKAEDNTTMADDVIISFTTTA